MNEDEIIPFFRSFKQRVTEKLKEIAEDNYCFCPFIRKSLFNLPEDFSELEIPFSENGKQSIYWANCDVFKYRYFYDSEYKLLCVFGVPDAVQDVFDCTVYFQNSCDQDYEKKCWNGVDKFEQRYEEWMTVDVDVIKKKYADSHLSDFDVDYPDVIKKSKALNYYRKTFAYEEIWNRYSKYLYNDENAIYLSLYGQYDSTTLLKFIKYCFDKAKSVGY